MENILLNIGILEDNLPLRETIEQYLELKGGYNIVFSTGRVGNILKENYYEVPDFILLDEHLEDASGIDEIKSIKKKFPESNLIVITGDDNPKLIMKALENGASGYLYKPFTLAQVVDVFKEVIINGSFLQPGTTTKLINMLNKKKETDDLVFDKLTKKEKEIVGHISKGLSYKEIADTLGITFFTVNHHIKNIYLKYDVNSAGQLIFKLNNKN